MLKGAHIGFIAYGLAKIWTLWLLVFGHEIKMWMEWCCFTHDLKVCHTYV